MNVMIESARPAVTSGAFGTIRISPVIDQSRDCPHCGMALSEGSIVWHGMHVLIADRCFECGTEILTDLEVGHASLPYQILQIDKTHGAVHGAADPVVKKWLGDQLLKSLDEPSAKPAGFMRTGSATGESVVILNCIDHLYGHAMLKLLNAQRHIDSPRALPLIVLAPKFLAWMVPREAAEVWTVDIPLKSGQAYYPDLDQAIQNECRRFREIFVSKGYSHPDKVDIERFTGVPAHDLNASDYRVTFIWREDRLWVDAFKAKVLRRARAWKVALSQQNKRIVALFETMRRTNPNLRFTVAGLGTTTSFPAWIDDRRLAKFDAESERAVCRVYAESRLVIGIHGSNMLLPSAHAGMTLDLMPPDRWGNFAQDIVYNYPCSRESDPRLLGFRYRYIPQTVDAREVGAIAANMVSGYRRAELNFTIGLPSVESERGC